LKQVLQGLFKRIGNVKQRITEIIETSPENTFCGALVFFNLYRFDVFMLPFPSPMRPAISNDRNNQQPLDAQAADDVGISR